MLAVVLVALLFVGATVQGDLRRAIFSGSDEAGEEDGNGGGEGAGGGEGGGGGEGNGAGEQVVPERQCRPRVRMDISRVEGSVPVAPVIETLPTGDQHYLLEGPDARALSIAFTQDVFADCAKHVVVVESSDLGVLSIASRLAAFYNGPLLVNVLGEAEVLDAEVPGAGQSSAELPGTGQGSTETRSGSVTSAPSVPPQIHPDIVAEFQRLDPDAATVIGSIDTANELLVLMRASEESDQDVTLIPSSGARSDVASVAAYAASLMAGEAEEINGGSEGEPGAGDQGTGNQSRVSEEADQPPLFLPRRYGPATPVRVLEAISAGLALHPAPSLTVATSEGSTRIDPVADPAVADPAKALADLAEGDGPQWLVALDQPAIAVLAIPAINAAGGNLLYVAPDDLRASPIPTIEVLTGPPHYGTGPYDAAAGGDAGESGSDDGASTDIATTSQPSNQPAIPPSSQHPWRLVGPMPDDLDWQLAVLSNGQQLPGGGYVLFPSRRIVAMYGHTNTNALGVLGEQGPAEGVERAREIAQGYDADEIPVIEAFEIITTLASNAPGRDGNYSLPTSIADLRHWVDIAEHAGMYVILDLQPGRANFLSQAKEYEELLLKPHVGLALDPEWRLKPNEFHLRQIGSVDASEVNQVVDWLAQLVRNNNLPQKLLMVHQFSHQMITNRSEIRTSPELAVMIHMDGQGRSDLKFNTYAELTRNALDNGWWWGWKNFYDEDFPTLTPAQTLTARPVPYVVSYQ